jgi:hypothetical protein
MRLVAHGSPVSEGQLMDRLAARLDCMESLKITSVFIAVAQWIQLAAVVKLVITMLWT